MERRNSSENPLIKRLSHFAPLSDKDVRVLSSLCAGEKRYKAGSEIEAEGAAPRSASPRATSARKRSWRRC
jgi:hypothetical protein